MNAGRRATIQVCVHLIDSCLESEEISEEAHADLGNVAKLMQKEEYWSLRNMSKHVDKNDTTARQVAIAELALPLLEAAVESWAAMDLHTMRENLLSAAAAEPPVKRKSKPGLRKSKK